MFMLKYYPNVVMFDDEKESGVGIITGWKAPHLIYDKLSDESKELSLIHISEPTRH